MEKMYIPDPSRYSQMAYRRCGRSGLLLPEISFGLWQHFSSRDTYNTCRDILCRAFDLGVTHFDVANNYGSPDAGTAEETLGQILKRELRPFRDELIISTKAGYPMWDGPYGVNGSRKYLLASLDQSLKRMGLEYVDIFYSHRPDYETPLEETMGALAQAVHSGKALYVGISNYPAEHAHKASQLLKEMGVHCLIHQPRYSMLVRDAEQGLFDVLESEGIGSIVFQTLAQGLLTNRYLNGIPEDSRVAIGAGSLKAESLTEANIRKVRALNEIALSRGESLAQMAIRWAKRDARVTSVLIGASSVAQLEDSLKAVGGPGFTEEELNRIEQILKM